MEQKKRGALEFFFSKSQKRYVSVALALLVGTLIHGTAFGLTLVVEGINKDGSTVQVTNYRWLLEEDTTHPVTPGVHDPTSLSVSIHKSHAPVVASGTSADLTPLGSLDPTKRYFVSIVPDSGFTIGGQSVAVGQPSVTVRVNAHPLPTAQISVFVFEDNKSISGVADIPAERGLPNFSIKVFDNFGQVMNDVFGNPLHGLVTDANGNALIKNLAPGKYDIEASPTDGQPWVQTVTIGGGPKLGTAVKAGEPPYLAQAGILNMHVFIGFVRPFRDNVLLPPGPGTITGRVVNMHSSHPPSPQLYPGNPVVDCHVGLNSVEAGTETGLLAQRCNPDGTFSIDQVPPGTYQLVMWDEHLDNLMSVRTISVPAAGETVALGDVPIARWLGTLQGTVFRDQNGDGIRQAGEPGMPDQAINLRFKDGSMYQTINTDHAGEYKLVEVVPFVKWLIAEVDFARFKATGSVSVVDDGGPLAPLPIFPGNSVNTPQLQPDGNYFRSEPGLTLLEGVIVHADQILKIDWSKTAYGPDENGGISGIIFYATTRAENDPAFAAGETWEPGIPRVRVNLYLDNLTNATGAPGPDGIIDDVNGDGIVTLADVDNYPFGNFPGPEDIDRNYPGQIPGIFNAGDAVNIVFSDSFDDNAPDGCVGPPQTVLDPPQPVQICAETRQTWNQVRPALFDGGYAFLTYFPGGMDSGSQETPLPTGTYIVQAVPPKGYVIVKEEDRNVDFGDEYEAPVPMLLPPVCVGDDHLVPNEFSLFKLTDDTGANVPPYRAGELTPLCDRKQVYLNPGQNTAADFHMFTPVPKSGRIVGKAQNLFANQGNPNDPNFGGPLGAAWIPVSILDYLGNEIVRTYTDEWGTYNTLVPSTFSVHIPMPSGVSPNVVTICANFPSSDPHYNPQFDQPCINWEVFPGKTSYAITPVGAIAGFTGSGQAVDCELPDGLPRILEVNGPAGGPLIAAAGQMVTIKSLGQASGGIVDVPNPAYDGTNAQFIQRDYGFGATQGAGTVTIDGASQTVLSWTQTQIQIAADRAGQLVVTHANGYSSFVGVTLSLGETPIRVSAGQSIQQAIDNAAPGALIFVEPGVYNENLILWKPLRLQGYGPGSTIINAANFAAHKAAWQFLLDSKIASGQVTLVEGQRADLALEDGAGITVLAKNVLPENGGFGFGPNGRPNARIDGFTIKGATRGSGILVNGYARGLEISNNRFESNQGSFAGAIRVGWQSLVNQGSLLTNHPGYNSAFNQYVRIHNNELVKNGSLGNGAGVSLYNGSDYYEVTENFICGNYAALNGAGLAHHGLSDQGLIANNWFIFNEAFGEGGAMLIGGQFLPAGSTPGALAPGAGSVTVTSNLMQGNLVGDDGGGISLFSGSGQDVSDNLGNPAGWYAFNFLNNVIVNNVSSFVAAGIALSDTVNVHIIHNTIAHNDSVSTAAAFTGGGLTTTTPAGSGIVSRGNSPGLAAASGQLYVNPNLANNIIYHNRSFYWDATVNPPNGGLVPNATSPYWDLEVVGFPGASLHPKSCILSNTTDPHSGVNYNAAGENNVSVDPSFLSGYFNLVQAAPGANALANFPTFTPLTLTGDYHVSSANAGNSAFNTGFPYLAVDVDTEPRASTAAIGADEPITGPFGNVAPTIVSESATAAQAGQLYLYQVRATDPNGGALTFSLTNPPQGMTIDPATGLIRWQNPQGNSAEVTVQVTDADGLSATQTFNLVVNSSANQAPSALLQTIVGMKDMPVDITLSYTDLDGPGPYTFTILTLPASGMLHNTADVNHTPLAAGSQCDQKVTYMPNPDFTGEDSFTWKVNDGGADSNAGTVNITVGAGGGVVVQCPGDLDGDAVPDPFLPDGVTPNPDYNPNVVCRHVTGGDGYAVMADGRPIYMFGFGDVTGVPEAQVMDKGILGAQWPAPTIVVDEGNDFYLTLTNVGMMNRPDLFDPHTVHWHGFPEASSIFDGVPDASIAINMGSSLTYFYHVVEPGTYMWHCHVEATEHMQMGMLGNLYVRPKQNGTPYNYNGRVYTKFAYNDGDGSTGYDVEYPIQMGSFDSAFHDASEGVQPLPFAMMKDNYFMINGRGYPDTINPAPLSAPAENGGKPSQLVSSLITAQKGQRILLRISNLNVTQFNTLATLGIPMKVVGRSARLLRGPTGQDLSYETTSVTLGGGESVDVILDTANVPPGTYILYSTNLNLLCNNNEDLGGMMTEIRVQP